MHHAACGSRRYSGNDRGVKRCDLQRVTLLSVCIITAFLSWPISLEPLLLIPSLQQYKITDTKRHEACDIICACPFRFALNRFALYPTT